MRIDFVFGIKEGKKTKVLNLRNYVMSKSEGNINVLWFYYRLI